MKITMALLVAAAALAAPAFECTESAKAQARDFIENEKPFHLGFLPTEQSNPITASLEEDFRRSTLAGVQCLQRGDRQIPITMRHVFSSPEYARLVGAMASALKAPKGRIVFSGCGATGRLSILLESMWRDFFRRRAGELSAAERALADRAASIMTGGDFALIKSVEFFEDFAEGGRRQAAALGVGKGDVFVAITEGGETSSVLGTLDYASKHGATCFLVFNNPAYLLRARLERCRAAIDDPNVTVIDLYCGAMSVAGSTRMQATSSEQLLGSCALEAALARVLPRFAKEVAADPTEAFERLLAGLESPAGRRMIADEIDFEMSVYAAGGRITYLADDCMLDLFTDNTERGPTFMIPPLRPRTQKNLAQSWAYVKNPLYPTEQCWERMMARRPRCLEFTSADAKSLGMPQKFIDAPPAIRYSDLITYMIGNEPAPERIDGYARAAAVTLTFGGDDPRFLAEAKKLAAAWPERRDFAFAFPIASSPLEVWKHLAVKLAFNNLSTGTMTKLGRVSGNWMSWVSMSNKKLIDRNIRLIVELGKVDYARAAELVFAAQEWILAQDWSGREEPSPVQVVLRQLKRRELTVEVGGLTPQAALGKIRAARAAGDASPWTVRVKPGLHVLREPLEFRPEDSGDVAWVGEGEGCVFAGGERIVGWKDEGNGVWSAALPKNPAGKSAFFEQLWVNGCRAERARLPSKGYWKAVRGALEEDKANGRWIEKCFLSDADAKKLGEIPADELFYAQLCLIDKWTFARRILRGYDAAQNAAVCWSPCRWSNFCSWTGNDPVWFENVRSAFDAPGEWFYDAKNGKVLYRPLAGEDMAKAVVIAPSSEIANLVVFRGDPDKGRYVEGISFRGIAFECSGSSTIITDVVREATKGKYVPPKSGPTESWQYQAAQSADAAVMGFGARNISFERCAVRHTANYGLRFEDGCVSNRIVSCTLEDLGAGGVWMGARKMHVPPGEGDKLKRKEYGTIGPKSNAYNLISNCVIRTSGRFNPEGTGVALTHASDCRVVCNDIYDHYYTGVSVGFHWGYSGSIAQHNEIGFNRIYDLGKGIMSDMGGVYTLGTSFGTTVHDNVIHDVNSYSYGGWALYTDEGSEGIVMERNLCWNTTDGGFHQHYGVGCTIRNNIFAWNRLNAAVRSSRAECGGVKSTLNFINNIILIDKANFVNGLSSIGGEVANNLWWSTSGSPRFDGKDWALWQSSGREKGGMLADPGFTDARKYDFTFKGDSPAFKLGFKPWDYSKSGAR